MQNANNNTRNKAGPKPKASQALQAAAAAAPLTKRERRLLRDAANRTTVRGAGDSLDHPVMAIGDYLVSQETALARTMGASLSLPMLFPPVRGSVGLDSEETATAMPFDRSVLSFGTAADILDVNTTGVVLMRQHTRFSIESAGATGGVISYVAQFAQPTLTANSLPYVQDTDWLDPQQWNRQTGVHTEPNFPDIEYAWEHDGETYSWFDGSNGQGSLAFQVNAPWPAGAVLTLYVREVVNNGVFEYQIVLPAFGSPAANATFGIARTGYMAFRLASSVPAAGATQFDYVVKQNVNTGMGSLFIHRALPEFSANLGAMRASRVTAGSLLLSNYTPEIYRGGKVVGYCCPKGSLWLSYISGTGLATAGIVTYPWYNNVASKAGAVEMEANHGIYGFLMPSDLQAFQYVPLTSVPSGDGAVESHHEPLLPTDGYCMAVLSVAPPAAGSREFVFTRSGHVEFQTDDPWRTKRMSDVSPVEFEQALFALRAMPRWHENSNHLKAIAKWLQGGARGLGAVLEVGAPAAGAAGPLVGLAGRILSRLGEPAGRKGSAAGRA